MNQQQYDNIKQAAFTDELKKIAGQASEIFGAVGEGPIGLLGTAAGYHLGGPRKTEEGIRKADKAMLSNVLLPIAGSYRLGRRMATQEKNPDLYAETMKKIIQEKKDKKMAKEKK